MFEKPFDQEEMRVERSAEQLHFLPLGAASSGPPGPLSPAFSIIGTGGSGTAVWYDLSAGKPSCLAASDGRSVHVELAVCMRL
ncbi:hypothetical protein Pla52nx_001089 [Stieleria varia]|uniref:hypothetical protein n=1 Tax=Stieleria varia TaxID=2528005 RepID=UPI00313D571B